jgi:hypothetical protein
MKTAITALSALIVAAPAVLAQNVSSRTADPQHHARKHHRVVPAGYAPRQAMHAKGYPGAFGYAPGEPKDYTYKNSRNAGGGGGGGGGSGM